MTPVKFTFTSPDGEPIADAEVEITLARSDVIEDETGILLPRVVYAQTDAAGECTVPLEVTDTYYTVRVEDSLSSARLRYRFVVPPLVAPATSLRFQDLVIEGQLPVIDPESQPALDIMAARAQTLAAATNVLDALDEVDDITAAAALDATNQVTATLTAQVVLAEGYRDAALVSKNQAQAAQAAAVLDAAAALASKTAAEAAAATAATAGTTAAEAVVALKANIDSPTFTGTVSGITKAMVGLGSVDNTTDAGKPVSTAQQTALNLKANLASPALTGTPTAPTAAAATNTTQVATTAFVTTADNLKANLASPTFTGTPAAPTASAGTNTTQLATTAFVTAAANLKANLASPTLTGTPAAPTATPGTNTTQLATTAFVQAAAAALVDTAPGTLDTLNELAAALADDPNFAATTAASIALKAPLASPSFTGTVAGIDKTMVGLANVDNTADTAKPVSTAQQTALDLKANLAGPTFTGVPAAPTAANGTNTTQIATTAHVLAGLNLKANLASPTLTGTPAAPTAAAATNTTQIATTAFVTTADNLKANLASPTLTGNPTAPTPATGDNDTSIATSAFVQTAKTMVGLQSRSGATYTLALADAGCQVSHSHTSPATITVPANATVAFPVGTFIQLVQAHASGALTVAAAGGVTLNAGYGFSSAGQYQSLMLVKTATDTWHIT